jgi:predicted cobalt transporter CbtA
VALAYVALPGVDEVAGGFPATLLWRFRLASLGTQAVLWTTMGLLFGALTERSLQERRRQQAAAAAR